MRYIFAFGSLMWTPGFDYKRKIDHAVLKGYHRAFNVRSTVRWGTPSKPGATLGLEKGGECIGVLFEIEHADLKNVMEYLKEREGSGFDFPILDIEAKGTIFQAVTSMYDIKHEGFLGNMSFEQRALLVGEAKGEAGSNCEYVESTHKHLIDLGIKDTGVTKFYKEVNRVSW